MTLRQFGGLLACLLIWESLYALVVRGIPVVLRFLTGA